MSGRSDAVAADREAIDTVLADHPVRLAVLFGSAVTGRTHPHSDIDIAVEFDRTVDDVGTARLSLATDLAIALGTDDIDLAIIPDLEPGVGHEVTTEGQLLRGSSDRLDRHRKRFERTLDARDDPSPRERFDTVLDRIDHHLDGKT